MRNGVRHTARIILVGFLLNAFLPFFAVYDSPLHEPAAERTSSLFGGKVLICTDDGFKWAKWQDVRDQEEKHDSSSRYQCALCYLAAHGLKDLLAPGGAASAVAGADGSHDFIRDDRPMPSRPQSALHSRAPPLFFFS